jgi:hypothetical protein
MVRQLTVPIMVAAIAAGCTTPASVVEPTPERISIAAQFVDAQGNPIASLADTSGMFLATGAIAGSLWGAAPVTIQSVPIKDLSHIELDIRTVENGGASHAGPIAQLASAAGVTMTPAETRFARVSLLLYGTAALRDRWTDSVSVDDATIKMVLAYFDRPCRFTGVIRPSGEVKRTVTYDVNVDKAGVRWISLVPVGPNAYLAQTASTSTAVKILLTPMASIVRK